jgi:RNA polymerase sigma-70 factor (ECF subfamily)
MEMLQAYSSNVQPKIGASRPFVKLRRARPAGIESRRSSHLNSDQMAARHGMGEEWVVVQQAIAGNVDAQERLFSPHMGRLYRTAFGVLRNKEDAEDALQDGLCKAYTSLSSFQGRSSFYTWLTRIIINSALMTRRRKSNHREVSLDEIFNNEPEPVPHRIVDPRPDPAEICAAIEINTLVEKHFCQLPLALGEVFRLRAIYGLSAKESSQALGIPASAVKSRIFRARRKLASGLQQSLEITPSRFKARQRSRSKG